MGGRNLEYLVEVVNQFPAVTTITTGTLTGISADTVYKFQAGIKLVSTATFFRWYNNSDTTLSNYRLGLITSQNTANYSNETSIAYAYDDICVMSGHFSIEDGRPSTYIQILQQNGSLGADYGRVCFVYNNSETTITEIQFTGSNGLQIGAGSYIRLWEAIQSE